MIPDRLRRELRHIEIATVRALRTARLGTYTSRRRGNGFDFDQHTPYRPGDDVRLIDWNVTARMNAPFRRQTHAERELDVVLALDVSRSMHGDAGRHSKTDALMFICASVLFSAARDQITTGLLAFSDRVLTWQPPKRVGGAAWHALESIWALMEDPGARPAWARQATRIVPAARHLVTTLKTTTLVIVVSDFWAEDDALGSPELRMLATRHDVIAAVIDHPADRALPPGHGFVRARDVESGDRVRISLDDKTRRAYAAAVANHRRSIVDGCYRLGMEYAFVRTDEPVVEPLLELFARRKSA